MGLLRFWKSRQYPDWIDRPPTYKSDLVYSMSIPGSLQFSLYRFLRVEISSRVFTDARPLFDARGLAVTNAVRVLLANSMVFSRIAAAR